MQSNLNVVWTARIICDLSSVLGLGQHLLVMGKCMPFLMKCKTDFTCDFLSLCKETLVLEEIMLKEIVKVRCANVNCKTL